MIDHQIYEKALKDAGENSKIFKARVMLQGLRFSCKNKLDCYITPPGEFDRFVMVNKKNSKQQNRTLTFKGIYPYGYLYKKVVDKALRINWRECIVESFQKPVQLSQCLGPVKIHSYDNTKGIVEAELIEVERDIGNEKEKRSILMDNLDNMLRKLKEDSRVTLFSKISDLEDLVRTAYIYLDSKGYVTNINNLKYRKTSSLQKKFDIITEIIDAKKYSIQPSRTNESASNAQAQSTKANPRYIKYRKKLEQLDLDPEIQEEVENKLERYKRLPSSHERSNLEDQLDTLFSIPWNTYHSSKKSISEIRKELNSIQYGMKEAKERFIEYFSVLKNKRDHNYKGPILCMVGAPGTGKTLFAKNIAKVINRKLTSIPLGGMRDVNMLRGQRKGWIGAEPGQIIRALIRTKSMNPVIVLDEIDKISGDRAEAVQAALLEILDPNQNFEFKDNYIDLPVDISNVVFVATANYTSNIPLALYNRLEILDISPYTPEEKLTISKKFTLLKIFKEIGIKEGELVIEEDVIKKIIEMYRLDGGMRRVEQTLNKVARKYLVKKAEKAISLDEQGKFTVTTSNISDFIKLRIYSNDIFDPNSSVIGEINVLTTSHTHDGSMVAGNKNSIQVFVSKGSGKVKTTGSLEDMMRQSIGVAIGYLKKNSKLFDIPHDYFTNHDFHIHAPDIAVKKDGPSAGLVIAVALLSVIKKLPIPQWIGMTGEMDLNGNALPIGGVKMKITYAKTKGVRVFVLPKTNKSDFENDVEDKNKKEIEVHFIDNIEEALKIFFPDWNYLEKKLGQ